MPVSVRLGALCGLWSSPCGGGVMKCQECTPDQWCGHAQTAGEIDALDREIADLDALYAERWGL